MAQVTFRIALLFLILSTAATALTHARPVDDTPARALLDPSDACGKTCWSGIQPGVTTVDEALAALKANPWVDTITGLSEDQASTGRGAIVWSWKTDKPFAVDTGYGGVANILHGVVTDISMPTLTTLADVWLLLGPASTSATLHAGYPYADYDLIYIGYPERGLTLQLTIKRPITFSSFWGASVIYTYGPSTTDAPFRLPCWTACGS